MENGHTTDDPGGPPGPTDREIFERVRTHLLRQGRRSRPRVGDSTCRYRTVLSDGEVLMCAVGCLIPDDLYAEGLEGRSICDEGVQDVLARAGIVPSDDPVRSLPTLNMLHNLQLLHDGTEVEHWEDRLGELTAKRFSPEGTWLRGESGEFP